jgi:hypothetical protein
MKIRDGIRNLVENLLGLSLRKPVVLLDTLKKVHGFGSSERRQFARSLGLCRCVARLLEGHCAGGGISWCGFGVFGMCGVARVRPLVGERCAIEKERMQTVR